MNADVITFPGRAKPATGIPKLSGIPSQHHRVSDLIATYASDMKLGERETLAGPDP
jgi:hypothetical protein